MEKALKHFRFIEQYDVSTLCTVAAVLAITAYTLYRTTKSLKTFEIKDVDRSQLGEI